MILGFLAFSSCLIAVVLAIFARRVFERLRIVDSPDLFLKSHLRPVPPAGGFVLLISYAGALALAVFATAADEQTVLRNHLDQCFRLIPSVLIVFMTGTLDDIFRLRPWEKLIGQTASAVAACFSGLYLHSVANRPIDPHLGIPITIAWLILCTNALNLIDGVDGLAVGVSMAASLAMAVAGLVHGNQILVIGAVTMAGSLLGLLPHTFSPARIFLGDAGSLLIGLWLGFWGLSWAQTSETQIQAVAPIMALGLPILDTFLAIVRRLRLGRSIFIGDRGHIHHRLIDHGFSPGMTTVVLSIVSLVFVLLSVLALWQAYAAVGLFIVCSVIMIHQFCTPGNTRTLINAVREVNPGGRAVRPWFL